MTSDEALKKAIKNLIIAEQKVKRIYKTEEEAEIYAMLGQGWAKVAEVLQNGLDK